MPATSLSMTGFALDPDAAESRQDQIVAHLRCLILGGALRPGAAVPATRALARDLGVARGTVVLAYARLAAEGYLHGRSGSATRVSKVLPEPLPEGRHASVAAVDRPRRPVTAMLSARGSATAALTVTAARPGAALLAPGVPALDVFPSRLWERLSTEVLRPPPAAVLGYAEPGGYRPLREAIVDYLGAMRGVACGPDQVVVTAGSQQGIALTAHLLADVGDAAWVEDPAYIAGRHVLAAAGLRPVPVPVDAEGLDVGRGEVLEPRARVALVTPSHQYPLGAVMSLRRRLALLAWAERAGAWVIEDDYDGEFRYVGRPLQPLVALGAETGRVIYVGTFSKVLAPGLRLGYLVLPIGLVEAFMAARALADRQPPGPSQAVLAEFIARGHLTRHVRAMRTLYRTRRDALVDAVTRHGGGHLTIAVPDCGLHAVGYLSSPVVSDTKVYDRALRHGVQTPPLSAYYADGDAPRPGLLLGFANTPEDRIADTVRILAEVLQH